MSHTSTIDNVVFSDIEALKAAVAELAASGIKLSLEKGGTPRAYYGSQEGMGPALYTLRVHDAQYDVGFYPRAKGGGMEARTDFFMGSVAKQLGVKRTGADTDGQCQLGKLNQMYAVHAATRKAVQGGMTVRRMSKDDGSIRLVVTGV